MSTPEIIFGLVLKQFRIKKGLSQEKLAHESGVDRTFISLLERGLRQPSLTTILNISTVLDIKASSIVADVESQLELNSRKGAK